MPVVSFVGHSHDENVADDLSFLLDKLKDQDYKIISPDDFSNRLKRPSLEKEALITFDDGYEEECPEVVDILCQHKIKALCFLIPLHYSMRGSRPNWDFWKKHEDVFEVGSHSLTHSKVFTNDGPMYDNDWNIYAPFQMLFGSEPRESLVNRAWMPLHQRHENPSETKNRLVSEIWFSKQMLEHALGKECRFFSYPWGAYSGPVIELVKTSGYQAAFSTTETNGSNFTITRTDLKDVRKIFQ